MTPARLKQITRQARRAPPDELHDLYMEVYGADYSGNVTDDRARESISEACAELLSRKGEPPTQVEPRPERVVSTPARQTPPVKARPRRTLLPL